MVASQFRELAHELLRRNRAIAGGEMLWGAVSRIILAINLQHGIIRQADHCAGTPSSGIWTRYIKPRPS